jgi:hypothetical protein
VPAAIFFVPRFQSTNDQGVKTLTTDGMIGRSRFVHLTRPRIRRSNGSKQIAAADYCSLLLIAGKFTAVSSRRRGVPVSRFAATSTISSRYRNARSNRAGTTVRLELEFEGYVT